MEEKQLIEIINQYIQNKNYDGIKKIILENKEVSETSNVVATIFYLTFLYEEERKENAKTIFDKVKEIDELLERYIKLKFWIRRIDFMICDGNEENFLVFLLENRVSPNELKTVIEQTATNKDHVWSQIRNIMKD